MENKDSDKLEFNIQRGGLAWVGALGVITGVGLYVSSPKQRNLATILFAGGWILIAVSAADKRQRGFFMTIAVLAIILGAGTSRRSFNKGENAPMWAMMIFLLGWGGVALFSGDALKSKNSWRKPPGIIGILGAVMAVTGVFLKRKAEQNKTTPAFGQGLFVGGFGLVATAIATST